MNPQELDELFKQLEQEAPTLLDQLKWGKLGISYIMDGKAAKYGFAWLFPYLITYSIKLST